MTLLVTCERRTLRRKRLPALFTSRCTRDRRSLSNRHVTKLTSRSRHSLVHLTVKNDPGTQPLFNQHQDKVAHIANLGPAQPQLSKRCCIRVVVDCHRSEERRVGKECR